MPHGHRGKGRPKNYTWKRERSEGDVDSAIQLDEDGGVSREQSCMEKSGLGHPPVATRLEPTQVSYTQVANLADAPLEVAKFRRKGE